MAYMASVKNQILNEINLMRPICILSIILGHSFAVYSGAWTNSNIPDVDVYKFINPIFISFQLSAFAFISGYLFEHLLNSIKVISFIEFIKKKFSRLMFPAILLGFLYVLLYDHKNINLIYILSGPGHLWFLPMIFWAYIFLYIIRIYIFKKKIKLFHLIIISCLALPVFKLQIPIGLSNACYYLPYLLFGCLIYSKRSNYSSGQHVYSLIIFFLIYIMLMSVMFYHKYNLVFFCVKYVCNFIGIIWLWNICFIFKNCGNHIYWKTLCKKSFGLYLFHQFILIYLYYHCTWILKLNMFIIPIIGFIMSLSIAWFLTSILQKTVLSKYIS